MNDKLVENMLYTNQFSSDFNRYICLLIFCCYLHTLITDCEPAGVEQVETQENSSSVWTEFDTR